MTQQRDTTRHWVQPDDGGFNPTTESMAQRQRVRPNNRGYNPTTEGRTQRRKVGLGTNQSRAAWLCCFLFFFLNYVVLDTNPRKATPSLGILIYICFCYENQAQHHKNRKAKLMAP